MPRTNDDMAQPLKHRCPHCKAAPGSPCRKVERFGIDIILGLGETRAPHGERRIVATEALRRAYRNRVRTGNNPFTKERGW